MRDISIRNANIILLTFNARDAPAEEFVLRAALLLSSNRLTLGYSTRLLGHLHWQFAPKLYMDF